MSEKQIRAALRQLDALFSRSLCLCQVWFADLTELGGEAPRGESPRLWRYKKAKLYLPSSLCCYKESDISFNHDCGLHLKLLLPIVSVTLHIVSVTLQSILKAFPSLKQQGHRKSKDCAVVTQGTDT